MSVWLPSSRATTVPRVPLRTPQRAVVLAADCAIADTELATAELERLGSESAGSQHQHASRVVELADVVAAVGEHDSPADVALGRPPPVFEESALGRGRVVLEVQPSSRRGVGEVRLWVAGAEVCERVTFHRVVLPVILRQADCAETVAEGGEEAAGTDGRKLAGVADQDRLRPGVVDQAEKRREDARLRHACFVDDQDAALRETALALGIEEEPVHCGAADARCGCELVGGAAAGRNAEDWDACRAVGRVEDAECGCLSGARHANSADDAVAGHASHAHQSSLLVRESCTFFDESAPRSGVRRTDVASDQRDLECLALDLEQLAGREARRPSRRVLRLDQLEARECREFLRRVDHIVGSGAVAHAAGDGADELRHGERRLLRREALAAEELLAGFSEIDWSRGMGRTYERAKLAAGEPVLGGARLPLLPQPREIDLLFRLAGRERRDSAGREAFRPARLHVFEQRLSSSREGSHRLLGDALEFGHAFDRLRPADAEPLRELVAEVGLVEVAGGEPVGAQDRLAVERSPLAVLGSSEVRDDHMRVQVRVLRPTRPMPVRGRDEAAAVFPDRAAATAADGTSLALEVAERRLP